MSAGRSVSVSLGSQTLTNINLNGGTANWAALGDTADRDWPLLYRDRGPAPLHGGRDRRRCEDRICLETAIPLGRRSRLRAGHSPSLASPKPRAACSASRRTVSSTFPSKPISRSMAREPASAMQPRAADQKVLEQAKDEMRMLIRARRHEQARARTTLSRFCRPTPWSAPGTSSPTPSPPPPSPSFRSLWWWAAW